MNKKIKMGNIFYRILFQEMFVINLKFNYYKFKVKSMFTNQNQININKKYIIHM